VAKPELGTKRYCASCAANFYDLNKTPITCPKCGGIFEVVPPVTLRPQPARARSARRPEVEAPEAKETQLISLEEADEEAEGKKAPVAEGAEDLEEDETIGGGAEDPLIEPDEEEENTDLSEIIGDDIEDEKET
jgi:uncharacterized protein (TIGR02300 family)